MDTILDLAPGWTFAGESYRINGVRLAAPLAFTFALDNAQISLATRIMRENHAVPGRYGSWSEFLAAHADVIAALPLLGVYVPDY